MLLPGPEAMQLATYAGWRLRGLAGGLVAGALLVLPGALVMLGLALAYAAYGQTPAVERLFLGIKAPVLVVVLGALRKVAGRALARPAHWALAVAAFVALFFLALPFPLVILAAAGIGALLGGNDQAEAPTGPVPWRTSLAALGTGAVIWMGPLVLLDGILREIGMFFAGLAVVTFGGAYAVLAWMAQDAVTTLGWLTAREMMDGLGFAETTPGPLILVTQFVGTLAAYDAGGWQLALAGAAVSLWATFVPCYLWIFAGAPHIERISAMPRLAGALSGITAAVVGVIANLSIWFALHVLFTEVTRQTVGPLVLWMPSPATLDPRVLGLSILAGVMVWRGAGLMVTLATAAALGWIVTALGAPGP